MLNLRGRKKVTLQLITLLQSGLFLPGRSGKSENSNLKICIVIALPRFFRSVVNPFTHFVPCSFQGTASPTPTPTPRLHRTPIPDVPYVLYGSGLPVSSLASRWSGLQREPPIIQKRPVRL